MQISKIRIIPYKWYWWQYRSIQFKTVKYRLIFATCETARTLNTLNCHWQTKITAEVQSWEILWTHLTSVLDVDIFYVEFAPVLVIMPREGLGSCIWRLPSKAIRNAASILFATFLASSAQCCSLGPSECLATYTLSSACMSSVSSRICILLH